MGCAVNGPGEAHDSQLGITFGRGVGMIFKDGVPMRKVAGEDIVEAFVMETEKLLAEIQNQPQINTDLSNTIESVLLNQR
jgi:(E)-4-hydroxy-3-methylbut-2-enyl-diphosphate synthase